MRVRNLILISIVALCIMLAGCGTYQYQQTKEIPISVSGDNNTNASTGDQGFKSEFEKLQKLLEEEGNNTQNNTEVKVVEEVVAAINETKNVTEEKDTTETNETIDVVEEDTTANKTTEETANKTTEVIVKETPEPVETTTKELTVPSGATKITVKEGELVNLLIKAEDPESAKITYTYTDPLDNKGKWQTTYGDAGTYKTTITASDGELSTSQDVYIIVQKVNRNPIITDFADLTVNEGETITLNPTVTDPEGGTITLEYSGWMTSNKKTTTYTDSGVYNVTLTATSSKSSLSAEQTITITVNNVNRPPQIISITNG